VKAKEMRQCKSTKLILKNYSTSISRTWSKQYALPVAHGKHCV